jgi:hypothetical protein
MERKKFFNVFGLGMMAILLANFSSLNPFSKNKRTDIKKTNNKIIVKINPLAVKRQRTGNKNV